LSKIVIIGNGIAGITAARHIRKNSDHELVVLSGESRHFFSRTALMYVYMGHMRWQDIQPYEDWFWEKNRIELVEDWVTTIDSKQKKINTKSGKSLHYDKLILALGSKPNKFGWPGQDLKGVQGLYSKQDLDSLEALTPSIKEAVVVGGGLIGVELAEMLLSRHIKVTFLVRETRFWNNVLPDQDADLVSRHLKKHHFDLLFDTELQAILDDGKGNVRAIQTKTNKEIPCQFVGLTAGVSPNIDLVLNSEVETKRGILINFYFETSVDDIYAIGDCAEFREPVNGRKTIEQVWYTGRIMGETLAQTICGNKSPYNPGPWFNSAKFFDLEYQTYGQVNSKLAEDEAEFYWEHPSGDQAVHVVWDKNSNLFKGINTFGIRMRHELFDNWIKKNTSVDEVMAHLKSANFDPEFYKNFENEIVTAYNRETGKNVSVNPKKWWRNLLTT
jgi:NAD(P)H-nitrite reductase large subunit